MTPVLGMRGTGSFTVTGQRPENWREMVLRRYPNGHAPLTAILSMLRKESTDDPIYHWFEQALPDFRIHVVGIHAAGVVTITVDDSSGTGQAQVCVRGSVALNERTGEVVWVSQDPANADEIIVSRGMGSVAAAQMNDNDVLHVYTTAYEQGADVPSSVTFDPTPIFNYTQIMRVSLAMTRTGMRTRLRTGAQYQKAKLEALDMISIQMENAFLWGDIKTSTVGGKLKMTTKGLDKYITTNAETAIGNITKAKMNGYLQDVMQYGSTNKLLLCGATFLRYLNDVYDSAVTVNASAGDTTYGLDLREWLGPFGKIYVKLHPLMSINPNRTGDAFIIDLDYLNYRYIDDLKFIKNRQSPGVDGRIDEYMVECGLEVHHEVAHMTLKGVTGAA